MRFLCPVQLDESTMLNLWNLSNSWLHSWDRYNPLCYVFLLLDINSGFYFILCNTRTFIWDVCTNYLTKNWLKPLRILVGAERPLLAAPLHCSAIKNHLHVSQWTTQRYDVQWGGGFLNGSNYGQRNTGSGPSHFPPVKQCVCCVFPPPRHIRWSPGCRVQAPSCWRLRRRSGTRWERLRLCSRNTRRSRASTV